MNQAANGSWYMEFNAPTSCGSFASLFMHHPILFYTRYGSRTKLSKLLYDHLQNCPIEEWDPMLGRLMGLYGLTRRAYIDIKDMKTVTPAKYKEQVKTHRNHVTVVLNDNQTKELVCYA